MPLRDHFRPPLDDFRSWDAFHAMWPATIVRKLNELLPQHYVAEPGVHLGTIHEIDVAAFRHNPTESNAPRDNGGALALATYAPPKPTLTLEPRLPDQDVYEVRVYKNRPGRHLVAAIELVSPSNKDRPETRGAFVNKVAELLKQDICVSIVDIVSNSFFNLYGELLNYLESTDPALGEEPPPIYSATLRMRYEGHRRMMDDWYHPLFIGGSLPTLPIWLTEHLAVSLDLEASYEVTCHDLRIK
jgi:hypothetical protein